MSKNYDAIIIGAGMSGMAAAIRLSMYDKKVCILEKHTISGGLNSFYARKGRPMDVGLHAMTNFAQKNDKRKPLNKLLRQLRIPYAKLMLSEQSFSKILFPNTELTFSNDPQRLEDEISKKFPSELKNYQSLLNEVQTFNELDLETPYQSARERIKDFIKDDDLIEMLLCPLLIYGSAWEMDMDFSQFVIMFKSIYLEGLSRPEKGVRTVINILLEKIKEHKCELRFKSGVKKILSENKKVSGVELENGEVLNAPIVFSSIGLPETKTITNDFKENHPIGNLSFTETIIYFDKKPKTSGIEETLIFYNNRNKYHYQKPKNLFDSQSAVICLPNNFDTDDYSEGVIRLTNIANYDSWNNLSKEQYKQEKEAVLKNALNTISKVFPKYSGKVQYADVFTPLTVERFTSHCKGTVYGSTEKSRDGKTEIDGLYICGTDQGFLGIVGSMLSGISIANLYGLRGGEL